MAQLRRQSFSGELFILPEEEENYENEEPNKDEHSDYRSEFELYYLNLWRRKSPLTRTTTSIVFRKNIDNKKRIDYKTYVKKTMKFSKTLGWGFER